MRRLDAQRGSSVIETALLLPVAMLLCLGGLDFSRAYIAAARVEASAAATAAQGARSPRNLDAARTLGLANLPGGTESTVSLEIVCACSSAPTVWATCEQLQCQGAKRRYARAVAQSSFRTIGRYPGLQPETKLRRERFVRAE
jgi:Flp pilus assembly protein TadG